MDNITKDPAYNAVDPTDFPAMMEVERYGSRSTAFDKIISATHDHFWDPLDTKYINFADKFDIESEYLINPAANTDLKTAIGDKLDEKQKIKLVNLDVLWSLSSILHGEQGALALSASLCHILRDPGAQEYAANQTREEARHVTGFSAYIKARWGKPVQGRARARRLAQRTRVLAARLEEAGRHADAGRGPGHGRVRDLLQGIARSAADQADAACDDRRSLPPQIRKDLGRPHHPASVQSRA